MKLVEIFLAMQGISLNVCVRLEFFMYVEIILIIDIIVDIYVLVSVIIGQMPVSVSEAGV